MFLVAGYKHVKLQFWLFSPRCFFKSFIHFETFDSDTLHQKEKLIILFVGPQNEHSEQVGFCVGWRCRPCYCCFSLLSWWFWLCCCHGEGTWRLAMINDLEVDLTVVTSRCKASWDLNICLHCVCVYANVHACSCLARWQWCLCVWQGSSATIR